MCRQILRAAAAVALLVSFWPALRLRNITIFDWSASVVLVASLLYRPQERRYCLSQFKLPIAGVYLLGLAGVLSLTSSSDMIEHMKKVAALLIGLCMMLAFAYLLSSKKIFTLTEALSLLAISGAISSLVVILQGQFGLLTSLVPGTPNGIQEWSRLTGLAEHPIEVGTTSAFSAVIALGLGIRSRRWPPLYLLPVIVSVYSMKYSASLTANFSLALGLCALFIFLRAYSLLAASLIGGALILGVALSSGALGTLLTTRLEELARDPNNYETLKYREIQWQHTVQLIDVRTLVVGNGYSTVDLPDQMDIHDGLLAALFHFGFLGLVSQCLLIWFFVSRLWGDAPRRLKGILMACIVAFASAYLTGPVLSRRSLWIPMFIAGAYLPGCEAGKRRRIFPSPAEGMYLPVRIAHS